MSTELFASIADRLAAMGLLEIRLYNWGEPFLHPRLSEIVATCNATGLRYSFSTNASTVPEIDASFVHNLEAVTFSMPGFSQPSYDRIHRLNFHTVTNNIQRFTRRCRDFGFRGSFHLAYHVYRFNKAEVPVARDFASRNGIRFVPSYAFLNDLQLWLDWFGDRLNDEYLAAIDQDICLDVLRQQGLAAPKKYRCPLPDDIVLNHQGDLLIGCCAPYGDPTFVCGRFPDQDLEELLLLRRSKAICQQCVKLGVAYCVNHSVLLEDGPELWQPSIQKPLLAAARRALPRQVKRVLRSLLTDHCPRFAAWLKKP